MHRTIHGTCQKSFLMISYAKVVRIINWNFFLFLVLLYSIFVSPVDDPSPLCSPFPRLPLISGCVKFNRIRTDKGHLRGCAKLEVRVTGTDAILWDMQFSCFKIGTDGIMFSNPNKNKDKPKPVKESIKEPVKKPMKKPNGECH